MPSPKPSPTPKPVDERFYCPKCRLILHPDQVQRMAHTVMVYQAPGAIVQTVKHLVVPLASSITPFPGR